MVKKSVDEGTRPVAHAGVHDETRLLVDDDDVVVLIDDVEGYGLGQELQFVWRLGEEDADDVEGLDTVVGLDDTVVHLDAFGLGGGLYFVARDAREVHLQIFVYAQELLAAVDGEAVVLVEFRGLKVEVVHRVRGI